METSTLDAALADRLGQLVAEAMRPVVREAVRAAGLPLTTEASQALPAAHHSERVAATVVQVLHPSPLLVELGLELEAGRPYSFEAGQFCQVFAEGAAGPLHRPYSFASPPSALPRVDLAVKDVNEQGESGWLHRRQVGDRVELGPALGTFTFRTPPARTAVFLATGTGVAPFRSMLRDQWDQGQDPDVWLFLGSPLIDALPYHQEFLDLAASHPRFHYVPVVSRAAKPWDGPTGHVQDQFLKHFQGRTDIDVYLCGVPAMVTDCLALLKRQGIPKAQVFQERFV